jgi:hypothetical protein
MPKTTEVFGIRTKPVLSYVERDAVDGRFKDAINSEHHVVVYGSSKQRKTSLRQTYVPDERCLIMRCAPNMQPKSIYCSLLRQTDVRIETITTSTEMIGGKVASKMGFKAYIPFLGGGKTEIGGEVSGEKQTEFTQEFVAFDFGEAQSLGELLLRTGFNKFVVLENFHYLPVETQQQIAFDLKTFHEIGIRFIVLGIWREANLLTTHNADLQDRLIEIPVEPWEETDFRRVMERGSKLLNINIDKKVEDLFIANSYGNVGMLQEFLRVFCELCEVMETTKEMRALGDVSKAEEALQSKLVAQRAHTLKALQSIAARSRIRRGEDDPLLLPYYLVIVVLRVPIEELRNGIERNHLLELLREVHHREDKETIRISDLTNLLLRLPSLQTGIQPPFLYYDSNSRRLRIVDTRQFFVLANVNRKDTRR